MNKDAVKAKAKALQSFMAQQGFQLKYSAAIEAIARIEGLPSYNVLQSRLDAVQEPTQAPQAQILVSWDVEVCRVGYAHATVIVKGAKSYAEAAEQAKDEVSDDAFSSEKSSDYFIAGQEPSPDAAPVPEDDKPGLPQDWEVTLCRMSYGTSTFNIPGHGLTQKQAEEVALDQAGNHYFSMDDGEYVVTGVYPLAGNR